MAARKEEQASIEFEGATIEYTVVRSARRKKTVEIALDPERGVLVRSPARTPSKQLADMVRQRAGWIVRKMSQAPPRPQARRFTDGETLPYLGRELPIVRETVEDRDVEVGFGDGRMLQFTKRAEFGVRLEDDAFRISVPADAGEEERVAKSRAELEAWYRKEAARVLPEAVERWQGKVVREKPSRVLIRNQRRRWGSCSSDGSIRLNWRVVMAEPALIDYVVVHELAHLAVMDHSPRYWKRVERAIPDYKARRKRLNDVGAGFWF